MKERDTNAARPDGEPPVQWRRHSSHWGVFDAAHTGDGLKVRPFAGDPDPNRLIDNLPDAIRHGVRIPEPMVRLGWLRDGPGPDARRGSDDYVPMSWDEILDRLARELRRVVDHHGTAGVFGGSYGWSSAGRFHHAQSQLHRFLNVALGGYVRSVHSYSSGAAQVVLPHVVGGFDEVTLCNVSWEQITRHTDVVLAFGGMALKNSRVAAGGVSRHIERQAMAQAAGRGCRFYTIGPQRDDLPTEAAATWLPVVPGTDVALMLGIAHTLVAAGLHDRDFVVDFCDGWPVFEDYLLGRADGLAKNAVWAAALCGIDAAAITELALGLAGKRVLVTVAHSLQRADHGEQPVWMGLVLAALLGQVGLEGGGYSYALGSISKYGRRKNAVSIAALPQGVNHEKRFIPCARIADMLLSPGEAFPYNGRTLRYPHIRLAYWAGGNPFHHHQDLGRLAQAFQRLDTFVVHEIGWTATAKHADIVLPCTMTLERDDIGASPTDDLMVAMQQVVPPYADARNDYDIFSDLAQRMGCGAAMTEGRSASDWLQWIYAATREQLAAKGLDAPSFDAFWEKGELRLPQRPDDGGAQRAFRLDPAAHPLPTPSGRIQIASAQIAAFGYDDCPGHPAWLPPADPVSTAYPLYLVANQPANKLHSQFDYGGYSQASKREGREVCTLHPALARAREIGEGDIVRIYSPRGSCLAAATLSTDIREDVVRLPTGAWYDPEQDERGLPMCVHGNPNAVTRDAGTSSLAQGCSGQLTAVQIEKYLGPLRDVRAYCPPAIATPPGPPDPLAPPAG